MAHGEDADLLWYTKNDPHRSVGAYIRRLESHETTRRDDHQTYLRLYSEREWSLASSLDIRSRLKKKYARKRARLSLNVVKNCVDAWVALLQQSRSHITFLTKGADWGLQRKARLRTRFCEALFHAEKFYDIDARVAKAAGIFGIGALHVVKEHGRIRYEFVQPGELVVDPTEAQAGDVRTMARVRTIDRQVAMAIWPEHKKAIDKATAVGGTNRLEFIDIWHLPSGPKTNDGWHAQVIPDVVTLSKKPYRWRKFPICVYRFDDAPVGWDGVGIAESLIGMQYEINVVLRTIQANAWSGGNLKVGVARGSNVAKSSLSNALGGTVIEYNEKPPIFFTHDVASPQLFQYLQDMERKSYDIVGISQMNAQSMTPFASMSGRAKLIHNQSYSQRFVVSQRRHEEFAQDVAERSLEAAADLAEDGQDIEVIFPGSDHLETVRYSDVAGEQDEFDCQAWSASLAGETPAARLAHIEQMMGMGMIDLAGAMYLYEVPHDLRAHMESVLAPIELAREAIDKIIEEGRTVTPTPMMDLQYAMKLSQLWFQRGMLRGVEESRLYLLKDFHSMCLMLLQSSMQQQAPAPGQEGAPPELAGQNLQPGPMQLQAPM
jgi:hypothetical protein